MGEITLETVLNEVRELREAIAAPPILSWSETQAADILGMSVVSLQRVRRNGQISYTPIAGKARYTNEQLEAYVRRNAVPSSCK